MECSPLPLSGKHLGLRKAEGLIFLAGMLLLAVFHGLLFFNAGALWRDEVSSARLVNTSSWSEMYQGLITDSFPPLWITLLRLWHILGFGAGDNWLRLLGLLLSLSVIVALWVNSRMTTGRIPMLALTLVGFNSAVFYWGDSVRAYSLALVLIIPLFGCVWKVTEKPTVGRVVLASMIAVLAAQSNYQNSYLILGICLGGATVCLWQGFWRRAALVLAIGFVAALSLLPLMPYLSRQGDLSRVVRVPLFQSGFFSELVRAFGSGQLLMFLLWAILFFFILLAPAYFWLHGRSQNSEQFYRALFAGVSLLVSAISMAGFVHFVGMPTLAWHYVPFIGLVAICAEMVVSVPSYRLSVVRVVGALVTVGLCFSAVTRASQTRRTNMDLIAAQLAEQVAPGDFVLVNPFFAGVSFGHYYHGEAPWSTLPVLAPGEPELNAIPRRMADPDPLRRTIDVIERTLKSGKRVWFVGHFLIPPGGAPPTVLPPAPHPLFGWSSPQYVNSWSYQIGYFLRMHSERIASFRMATDQPVNGYEKYSLRALEGWIEPAHVALNASPAASR